MSAPAAYLSVEEAQRIVLEHVRPGRRITLPLSEVLGYTLAEPIRTDLDYPPFDRSMMDGFAVRADDVRKPPVSLKLVGDIAAGAVASRSLDRGNALRINTGAPVPTGADTVVRLEDAELSENGQAVIVRAAAAPGQHIARRAEYVREGQIVLEAGCRLRAGEIGVAGSAGAHRVLVYDRPGVAVLSTGDELVDIDQVPAGPQIRNSNSYVLMALVEQAGGRPTNLGNVRDDRAAIAEKIREGMKYDALCITGGVSMGQFDLVPGVLGECGVQVHFHKMKTKPAKPSLFATAAKGTPVFALPGNPISAFVGFWLLARPGLAAMQGRLGELPRLWPARLKGQLKAAGDRASYTPARIVAAGAGVVVEPVRWGGSGDPFGMARADAMIARPIGAPGAVEGDPVEVILLEPV